MGLTTFFCSELSREVAEKTFGTASIGEVWILLEYPYPWGTHALDDSDLPQPVKAHLKRAAKSIQNAKILLIKQERAKQPQRSLFVVRCRERKPFIRKFTIEDYNQLLEIDFAAVVANKSPARESIYRDPLYLVCTHGRRDKCCAKFGYPLYKSLHESDHPHTWQSSHVGGDRFAANLICFPHGLCYARVTESAGKEILTEYAKGRMTLQNYRGRACFSNAVQAAEYFIRTESGIREIGELSKLYSARTAEESWEVRFLEVTSGTVHTVHVSRGLSTFQSLLTCHATEPRPVMQFRLDEYKILQP